MMSCCQTSKEKMGKDPQKYLKSHVMVCMLEGSTIVCSIAEKKNNSGIMYNDRYLLLHGHSYLGYFNEIEKGSTLPYASLRDVPKMKYEVPLKNFIEWEIKDKVFILKYFVESKGKKENKEWVFKFDTIDLSKDWRMHLKRAEKERKDFEKREEEIRNNPPSIVDLSSHFKDNKGVVGVYKDESDTGDNQKDLYRSKGEEKMDSRVNDPIKIIEPDEEDMKMDKVGKPTDSKQDDPHPDRIIDLTRSGRFSKIKTPPSPLSPKSAPSIQSPRQSMRNSKLSPIDNIHARSPSLNSSLRQSPSPPSNSHVVSVVKPFSPKRSEIKQKSPKSNILNAFSSKAMSQHSSLVQPKEVQQISSPRWKQPTLMKQRWNTVAQKQNLPYVLHEFSRFSGSTSRQIVDSLSIGNPELKLRRKSEYQLMVESQGYVAFLCFLNENPQTSRSQAPYQQNTFVEIVKEFNNLEYTFTCLQNKIEPFVVLTSITFYKGILIFLVSSVTSAAQIPPILSSQLYQKVIQKTRISSQFQADALRTSKQLNKIYLTRSKEYLPSWNSVQLQRTFLQLPDFESQKFQGTNLNATHSKNDRRSEYFKKVFDEHLKSTVECLDTFSQYVVDSKQFQMFLERHGVNELLLGDLYDLSSNPYIKQRIGFQCIFRIAKEMYFKELQMTLTSVPDMTSNLIIDKNILLFNSNKTLIDITIDFLNSMVGRCKNSNVVWDIINSQLGERFNLYGIKVVFDDGYYLQGLLYHFNIGIDWSRIKSKKGFDPVFVSSSLNQFRTSTRVYNCDFHLQFKGISKLLKVKSEENYKILLESLDLFKLPIPQYYKLNGLYQQIKVYLSLFLSPQEQKDRFPHLKIYQEMNLQPPTSTSIEIHMNYLKWSMRNSKKQESLKVFDEINSIINRWMGPSHPYLMEIYSLLSTYHESMEDYDDAITLAKSAIVIALNAFGNNSVKLAECYSFLADINSSMQRHDESLIYEKKAKGIYQSNNYIDNISYILMLTRISRLQLHFGKVNQAKENITECLKYFENHTTKQEHMVSAYQIAARCYEVTKDTREYKDLASRICYKLPVIADPLLLQKCVKIVIIYPLKELKKECKFILKQIVEKLPRTISQQSYIEGYQYIRGCFKEDRFDVYVQNTLKNAKPLQSLENTMGSKGNYTDNRRVVGLIEALRNFLGAGFVMKFIS